MGENRKPVFWSCRDVERLHCTTLDEAVEYQLDGLPAPGQGNESLFKELGEITVTGYARQEVGRERLAKDVLERALEELDCAYADPENPPDPATPAMKDAALVFADAILADYVPWVCEPICEEKVNALEWVRANAPHWLKPK